MLVKDRILIIGSEEVITILRNSLETYGYQIFSETLGERAIISSIMSRPILIFLDNELPGANAQEIREKLSDDLRTQHIPVTFLAEPDNIKNYGFYFSNFHPDDHIAKPVDSEEAHLHIQFWVRRLVEKEAFIHPISKLPTGKLIEEQLRRYNKRQDWQAIRLRVKNLPSLHDDNEIVILILDRIAQILAETVGEHGAEQDFIGHPTNDEFIVIASSKVAKIICQKTISEFTTRAPMLHEKISSLSISLICKP